MTANYKILAQQHLIIVTYGGKFTVHDILDIRGRVAEDPQFNPDLHVIDDVTAVEEIDLDFNFAQMSETSSKSLVKKGIKRALVAKTDLQYGMARSYQMLSENAGHIFQVFRDFDQAYTWITDK